MSESSITPEAAAAVAEVDAILKEPKLLKQAEQILRDREVSLTEAFKKSSTATRDLAACIATARLLANEMPEVADRIQIFQLLARKNDPREGAIVPKVHSVLGLADEKGQPVQIIDPLFMQIETTTPFLIGSRDEVLPKYTEPTDPHPVIPIKVERNDLVDFMDRNQAAINTFTKALNPAA